MTSKIYFKGFSFSHLSKSSRNRIIARTAAPDPTPPTDPTAAPSPAAPIPAAPSPPAAAASGPAPTYEWFEVPDNVDETLASFSGVTVGVPSSGALITRDEGEKFIAEVARAYGIAPRSAMLGVSIICQKGGTAKKAQPNIYATVDGKTITLGRLREIATNLKLRYTLRQFARTFGTAIAAISEAYSIPGDLAKKIQREKRDVQEEHVVWLSNFQMDNPDAPEAVRELLFEHYKSLFRPSEACLRTGKKNK